MVFAFSRQIFLDVSGERLRYQTAPCGNLARGARTRPAYTAIHGAVLGTASIAPLEPERIADFSPKCQSSIFGLTRPQAVAS
jgi:hypothetical protein